MHIVSIIHEKLNHIRKHWYFVLTWSFLFWTNRYTNLNTSSCPFIRIFSNSSVNTMLSWIIFIFFDCLRSFSGWIWFLFIYPDSLSAKYWTFTLFFFISDEIPCIPCISCAFCRLFIIKRRSKVNFNICINDTKSIIFIFRFNLNNVDLELAWKCCDSNGITFM